MANAGTITVDFAAEVARFNAQMKQVNDRVKSVESSFKKMAGVVDNALKLFSVGIAANFIRSAGEAADALAKTADKLGLTTERLTAFQLAAADAGVETESLTKLLVDSQRRLGDAAGGTGATADALRILGLNVRELQQLSPDELFLRYADSLAQVKNRSEQFALAQDLFGKSAQEAFTLIASGRGAIDQAAATVDKLGLSLSRVDIAKIEVANDKLALLAKTSQAFGQQVAAALAPFVSEFVDRLTSAGVSVDDTRSKLETFATAVFVTFEIIANAARTFDAAISGALFALVKPWERMFELLRRTAEFTAKFDAALGFDGLSERWTDLAQTIGEAESFLGAVAERSADRVKNAADSIKSFSQIFDEAEQLRTRAQQQAEDAAARQAEIAAGITGGESVIEKKQIELFQIEEVTSLHYDNMLQLQEDFLRIQAQTNDQLDRQAHRELWAEKVRIAAEAEQKMLEFKQKGYSAATSLLTAYNGKFKVAAQAILVVQKAMAIKEAIMDTHAAVMKTYAKLGYPWGIPAAIAVAALGAARVAAIASETGLFGGTGGGRSEMGSPNNPVFTDSTTANTGETTAEAGATQRTQITVNFTGLATAGAAREIAEALKDVIDNSDIHIIGPNSSQAREIRGE